MSVGLDDLKKKRLKKNLEKKSAAFQKEHSTSKQTKSSRPWSNNDLSKAHAAMNEEWSSNMRLTPFFWVDLREHSTIMRVQDSLARAEEQIQQIVRERVLPLLAFCSLDRLKSRSN